MENLFNNGIFTNQTNLGWTFSFEANGKYPIIANRIFESLADASTFMNGPTAIPGLILRVVGDTAAHNGAYLLETDGTGLKMNKIMTGDIDIQLAVVWAKESTPGAGDWQECDKTTPGAVQCLRLTHGTTKTYIPLDKILVLDDYAKIADVDASLAIRDASIVALDEKITDVSIDLNDQIEAVEVGMMSALNTVRVELSDKITDVSENVNARIDATETDILTLQGAVDELDSSLANLTNRVEVVEETYAKIVDVDASFAKRDISIADLSNAISDLQNDVINISEILNAHDTHLGNLDSSVIDLKDDVAEAFEAIATIDASIVDIKEEIVEINEEIIDINEHIDVIDSSIEKIEETIEKGIVSSIKVSTDSSFIEVSPIDASKGDVEIKIDASILHHANEDEEERFDATGLTTDAYVEERIAWYEIE